mmetsp:Transcript_2242/g.5530  ORF Transcript_2242/g.5530 Transcript_2242/m.5530 type:complete len:274 (+) Transcript_2242:1654-2475(+)
MASAHNSRKRCTFSRSCEMPAIEYAILRASTAASTRATTGNDSCIASFSAVDCHCGSVMTRTSGLRKRFFMPPTPLFIRWYCGMFFGFFSYHLRTCGGSLASCLSISIRFLVTFQFVSSPPVHFVRLCWSQALAAARTSGLCSVMLPRKTISPPRAAVTDRNRIARATDARASDARCSASPSPSFLDKPPGRLASMLSWNGDHVDRPAKSASASPPEMRRGGGGGGVSSSSSIISCSMLVSLLFSFSTSSPPPPPPPPDDDVDAEDDVSPSES